MHRQTSGKGGECAGLLPWRSSSCWEPARSRIGGRRNQRPSYRRPPNRPRPPNQQRPPSQQRPSQQPPLRRRSLRRQPDHAPRRLPPRPSCGGSTLPSTTTTTRPPGRLVERVSVVLTSHSWLASPTQTMTTCASPPYVGNSSMSGWSPPKIVGPARPSTSAPIESLTG